MRLSVLDMSRTHCRVCIVCRLCRVLWKGKKLFFLLLHYQIKKRCRVENFEFRIPTSIKVLTTYRTIKNFDSKCFMTKWWLKSSLKDDFTGLSVEKLSFKALSIRKERERVLKEPPVYAEWSHAMRSTVLRDDVSLKLHTMRFLKKKVEFNFITKFFYKKKYIYDIYVF